jgi:ubiquinone/menaquinone biosynthesis C-methylase UbiE
MQKTITTPYVASPEIANRTLAGNQEFDTGGAEHRTQPIFGEEIWLKLNRLGFGPNAFQDADVLEVCAGTGFLTYHLLKHYQPKLLTVNDISKTELSQARKFIDQFYPNNKVDWVLGDMHSVNFGRQFDVIIGNSFLHHFYDVPQVLSRFVSMLKPGGVFITLHEPTPMSTVVEGAKIIAWPLAVIAPGLINDIARARFKGYPSATDLWMFEAKKIKQVAKQAGFVDAETTPWSLLRAIVTQRYGLHLSDDKPSFSESEDLLFSRAIRADAILNRFLPQRCFGSICLLCRR